MAPSQPPAGPSPESESVSESHSNSQSQPSSQSNEPPPPAPLIRDLALAQAAWLQREPTADHPLLGLAESQPGAAASDGVAKLGGETDAQVEPVEVPPPKDKGAGSGADDDDEEDDDHDPLLNPAGARPAASPRPLSTGAAGVGAGVGVGVGAGSGPGPVVLEAHVPDLSAPADGHLMTFWNSHRERVLRDFSVSGSAVTVAASFLGKKEKDATDASSGDAPPSPAPSDGASSAAPTEDDVSPFSSSLDSQQQQQLRTSAETSKALSKAKMRLEYLEANSGSGRSSRVSLTQKEYTDVVNSLHGVLIEAWSRNQRVKALKKTIECSKVLTDLTVPRFYPAMWVLVTDILDTFAGLVHERIHKLAAERYDLAGRARFPVNFSAADVPPDAKETARNWFFKIACIRELVPRLYVEIALLRCYRFLSDAEYPQILSRISNVIRGIGDPLVAVYCRAYLARATARLPAHLVYPDASMGPSAPSSGGGGPERLQHLFSSFYDYMFTMGEFDRTKRLDAFCTRHELTREDYDALHGPAVELLLRAVGRNGTLEQFKAVMGQFHDQTTPSPFVLGSILSAFPCEYYRADTLRMVALVKAMNKTSPAQQALLYARLAEGLQGLGPPTADALPFLNEVWKDVVRVEDLEAYTKCSAAFVELAVRYYTDREVIILLRDLVKHVQPHGGDGAARVSAQLDRVCNAVCSVQANEAGGFSKALASDSFMRVLDMFKGERKLQLAKRLLASFLNHPPTSDPVLIHTMFSVARDLHDSLDALSYEDERRQISELICGFITKVDYGRDLEQQFALLVDCRAAFFHLNLVKVRLVLAVCTLVAQARRFVERRAGVMTKKMMAFVKSCLAYCHITIPSIDDGLERIKLSALCGEMAVGLGLLPQVDVFMKAAIAGIGDLSVSDERELVTALRSLASALIVVPGHPDFGPFYLVNGFVTACERYSWQAHRGSKVRVYAGLLSLLAAYAQPKFATRTSQVDSNDVLYGGQVGYHEELAVFVGKVLHLCSEELQALSGADERLPLEIELVSVLVAFFEPDSPVTAALASQIRQGVETMRPEHPTARFWSNVVRDGATRGRTAEHRRIVRRLFAAPSLPESR